MNHIDLGVLIPIVAIVFGVSAGMLSTWTSHKRKQQLMEQAHKERLVALERGLPLPDIPKELADEDEKPNAARSLRNGVALCLIGVVLYFALIRVGADDAALFGLIPAAIGVGNLIYAYMLRNKTSESAGAK
jgi:Domain of unknown function (DUF6249)